MFGELFRGIVIVVLTFDYKSLSYHLIDSRVESRSCRTLLFIKSSFAFAHASLKIISDARPDSSFFLPACILGNLIQLEWNESAQEHNFQLKCFSSKARASSGWQSSHFEHWAEHKASRDTLCVIIIVAGELWEFSKDFSMLHRRDMRHERIIWKREHSFHHFSLVSHPFIVDWESIAGTLRDFFIRVRDTLFFVLFLIAGKVGRKFWVSCGRLSTSSTPSTMNFTSISFCRWKFDRL